MTSSMTKWKHEWVIARLLRLGAPAAVLGLPTVDTPAPIRSWHDLPASAGASTMNATNAWRLALGPRCAPFSNLTYTGQAQGPARFLQHTGLSAQFKGGHRHVVHALGFCSLSLQTANANGADAGAPAPTVPPTCSTAVWKKWPWHGLDTPRAAEQPANATGWHDPQQARQANRLPLRHRCGSTSGRSITGTSAATGSRTASRSCGSEAACGATNSCT